MNGATLETSKGFLKRFYPKDKKKNKARLEAIKRIRRGK